MKEKKLLSVVLSFCLLFSQLVVTPGLAVGIEKFEIINVNRHISGSEFEIGEKIDVKYTVTPENIPYTEQGNENEKDIVLVVDVSGSMDERISNGNSSKSKLDIVKEVSREFIDKFKEDSKVNLSIIGYSDKVNFIYNNEEYNNINKDNISDICESLDIEESNIYYKYSSKSYIVNNVRYKSDKNIGDGLRRAYYLLNDNNGSVNRILNVYDLILENLKAYGSTNIGDGLRRAYYLLNDNNDKDKYIVMLTDGQAEAYSVDSEGQFKMTDGEPYKVNITYWWSNGKANTDYTTKSLEYAKKIATEKLKLSDINTFFIGFGNEANEDGVASDNLEIAQSAGGKYYNALDEQEINKIYDKIGKIIEINKSAKIHFEEKIPEGVTVAQEDIDKLPAGLRVEGNKIIGDLEEKVFYKPIKDESGNIIELRAEPVSLNITYTANSVSENCTFGEDDSSFVKYTFENGSDEVIRYFEPVTIKIKQYLERSLASVERILDTDNSEDGSFDVKYSIIPERIMKRDVSSNNDKKDIVLVLDTSGSMDLDIDGNETVNEYNKRLSIMKNTAVDFIDEIHKDSNVKIGLVQYNSTIKNFKSISNRNDDKLIDTINSMTAKGGTNIGEGLRKSYYMIRNSNGKDKYIVLMSDGFSTAFTAVNNKTVYHEAQGNNAKGYINNKYNEFSDLISTEFKENSSFNNVSFIVNYGDNDEKGYALQYAKKIGNKIKESNKEIKTFVIGFSNGANSEKLQQIADSAAGSYYKAIDENAMDKVYEAIEQIVEANVSANVKFQETIDGDIQIINENELPYGLHLKDGKLVGDISNIYYTLSEDEEYYEAEPIKFTVTYKPLNNGDIVFGQNKSSFIDYTTSADMKFQDNEERIYLDTLKLIAPQEPYITQNNALYDGKVKVTIAVEDDSAIEYRLEGETIWRKYTEPIYLDIETIVYARSRNLGLISNEISFTTYNPNAKAISSFTRNLPDKIAVGSEYEMRYKFDGDNIRYDIERPVEIVLVLNTSGTMAEHMVELRKAAESFIDNMPKDKDIKVGVVRYYGFGDKVSGLADINNNTQLNKLKKSIGEIKKNSGTNLGDALRLGYQLLDNNSNADKHFVIMSDGYANVGIIKKDGNYENGWENETYIDNLSPSINTKIKDRDGYTQFGLLGQKYYKDKDTDGDGLLDRFNIGHKYVTTIANAINESDININTHMIHFKRVSGAGDDIGARKNNNEVATILGVTKEVKPGQKFYIAENAEELQMAFNNVAGVIEDSISFNKVKFNETFPSGVEVIEYPNGLTYNKNTNTLYGEIKNIKMNNINKDMQLYKINGEFKIKVKFNNLGEIKIDEGQVDYIEPFESDEKNVKCSGGVVYVLDDSELSVKQTTIESNNPNNSTKAKIGDVITISIEASKDINKPVVTVLGNSADNVVKVGSDAQWKAYYTIKENDIEGKVNFDIQLKDKYLDNTIKVIDTTDGSEVLLDKTPPNVSIKYSTEQPTNGSVIATIKKQGEDFEVINNNSSRSYEFTENGSFTFRFKDETGNIGEVTATVTWIDKDGPEAYITYNPSILTNENVIATLGSNEDITITNNGGSLIYTFTENGEFTFEFKDKAGNTGSKTARVDWIDKNPPQVHVEYSTTEKTNSDVIATLVADQDEEEEFIVTSDNGDGKYRFSENGTHTFEYKDKAGNIGSIVATVDWIDKQAPTGYSISIDSKPINKNNFSFTISDAEVGTTYEYTIISSGGEESITGTGIVTSQNLEDIITDVSISGIDLSSLSDGIITVTTILIDEAGNRGDEVNDSVDMLTQEIIKQGVYMNGEINGVDEVSIVKTIPAELGALLKLSSDNTTIGLTFDKDIEDVTFRLIDINGNEVQIATIENTNHKYSITSPSILSGEYILIYSITVLNIGEINETIDINNLVSDTIKIKVIDLLDLQ